MPTSIGFAYMVTMTPIGAELLYVYQVTAFVFDQV